jgi:hypothetical protein
MYNYTFHNPFVKIAYEIAAAKGHHVGNTRGEIGGFWGFYC